MLFKGTLGTRQHDANRPDSAHRLVPSSEMARLENKGTDVHLPRSDPSQPLQPLAQPASRSQLDARPAITHRSTRQYSNEMGATSGDSPTPLLQRAATDPSIRELGAGATVGRQPARWLVPDQGAPAHAASCLRRWPSGRATELAADRLPNLWGVLGAPPQAEHGDVVDEQPAAGIRGRRSRHVAGCGDAAVGLRI